MNIQQDENTAIAHATAALLANVEPINLVQFKSANL
jgi:hypothetical protein